MNLSCKYCVSFSCFLFFAIEGSQCHNNCWYKFSVMTFNTSQEKFRHRGILNQPCLSFLQRLSTHVLKVGMQNFEALEGTYIYHALSPDVQMYSFIALLVRESNKYWTWWPWPKTQPWVQAWPHLGRSKLPAVPPSFVYIYCVGGWSCDWVRRWDEYAVFSRWNRG